MIASVLRGAREVIDMQVLSASAPTILRRVGRAAITLCVAVVLHGAALPRDAEAAGDEAVWTVFSDSNEVARIALDPQTGDLWAATFGGVVQWDVRAGTYRKYTTIDGLANNIVMSVAIDSQTGDKWFGTDGGGVSRLDAAGKWTSFSTADGLAGDVVDYVALDPSTGDKWFATWSIGRGQGQGVSRLDSMGVWTNFTTGDDMANGVNTIAIDHRTGVKWFGTMGGVSRLDSAGRWTFFTTADGLAHNFVYAIAIDSHTGDVWFGTDGGGVSRLDTTGHWTTLKPSDGERLNSTFCIVIDASTGDKWIGTRFGLYRVDASGHWTTLTTVDGLSADSVGSIVLNLSTGDKWFGTWGGVNRLNASGQWTTLTTADRLAYSWVTSIAIDPVTGDKWFGTPDGASRLDVAGGWTTFAGADSLANAWVNAVAIDPRTGDKWFGTWDRGVSRLDASGRWTAFTTADGLASNDVEAIAVDSNTGDRWFGTDRGASRLDATGRWTTFTTVEGLASISVNSVAVDPNTGDRWFGTWGGVSRLDSSGRWTTFTAVDGLMDNQVQTIAIDPSNGNRWFGTYDGVSRLNAAGQWTSFTTADGLAANSVSSIAIDPNTSAAWFGTVSGGVSRLDASGRWTTFTTADGLINNWVDSVVIDPINRGQWFGAAGGVSHLAFRPPSITCANPLTLTNATETFADVTSPEGLMFAFDIADPFTRIEIAVPDPDDRLSLTLLRSCDTNIGTGSGRHIGTGSGRHIGTDQRLVLDVTNQTGRYYLSVVPKPDVAASDLPLRVRVKLGVTRIDPRLVRTLVITHQPRIQALYGLNASSPELVGWRDALQRLAAHPSVGGHVIWNLEEETSPAVAAAYQRWLDQPREVDRANDVAVALRDWIWSARQSLTYVQYVVLMGDDRVIPHLRLAVRSSGERADGWVGEDRYMDEGAVDAASSVGAALLQNRTLTDDVYAAPAPISWGDGQSLYLPEIAVGRLVERPADMSAVMQAFLARDGQTTLKRSLVAGYDFMQDAIDQADGLFAGRGIPADMRTHLAGTEWSADALLGLLRGPRTDVAFLAAHADHHGYATPRRSRLNAADLATGGDLAGLIAYALACHGGLNVPGTEHVQALDLPEAWLGRGATYIGTTGWAYGLPHLLAYQERLMVDFTAALTNGDGGAVGDSLVDAKRRYAREHTLSAMHAKTLAGTVLYGLPMQRLLIERAVQVPDNVVSSDVAVTTSATASVTAKAMHSAAQLVGSDVYSITSRYPLASAGVDRVDTADGSYFTFSGVRPLAEAGQAVQPQMQVVLGEINRDSRIFTPRSAVLTGATYRDVLGFPPLIQAAQTFSPQHAVAARTAQADAMWVPEVPVHVRRLERTARTGALLFAREEATLLLTAGKYHGGTGIERLFEEMELDQYYSSSSDVQAPTIAELHASTDPRGQAIRARLDDASGIARAVAAYDAGGGAWRSVELAAGADGEWEGVVPGAGSWLLQAVDKAGNAAAAGGSGVADGPGPACPRDCTIYLPYGWR